MTKAQKQEQQEAIAQLREWIKPGDTVYTILEHVSRSGMQREIRVLLPYTREDGTVDFLHPNHAISKALGLRQGKSDGLIMGGCGMDMGFALVHELSYALYGRDGFQCLGKGKCPSNYHSNHRDTIRCEGSIVYNPDGPDTGTKCYFSSVLGFYSQDEETPCPQCKGEGRVPNPDGPERFDLVHTDGYALRHRWL